MRGTVTISVDVEDWHQLVTRKLTGTLPECSPHVEGQTNRVLDLLDANGVKGTFFVLGMVARAKPELVRRIAERGHEVASHGMLHVPLHTLDRARVRTDLTESRAVLSDIIGQDVVGFRAPEFSIMEGNRWALDEIAAAGYRYDSSIYPIAHRRYGISDFARGPVRLELKTGRLWELPLATVHTPLGNLPVGGGGYFRLLPGIALETAVRTLTGRGENVMLYFHPYEFTASALEVGRDVLPRSPRDRVRAEVWLLLQALGRGRLPARAQRALRVARCVRSIDLIDALDSARHTPSPPSRNLHDARN
jgi:polysaccharide deacetylase family protein (PEP-CTERM system associated)